MSYLANVPDYIGSFFSGYKKPLIVLGAILASFVTVKVTLAVLDAIDGYSPPCSYPTISWDCLHWLVCLALSAQG
jgi:hypothetical protein